MKISKIKGLFIGAFLSLIVLLFGSWLIRWRMDTYTTFTGIGLCFIGILIIIWHSLCEARKEGFKLPDWLTGSDVMKQFDIGLNILIEHVRDGLPAYPAEILHDATRDEAPPTDDVEWLLSSPNLANEFGSLCFKTAEVERFIAGKRRNS